MSMQRFIEFRVFRRTKNLSRRTRSRLRSMSLPSKLATFASAAAHAAAIFFSRKPRFPIQLGLSSTSPSTSRPFLRSRLTLPATVGATAFLR